VQTGSADAWLTVNVCPATEIVSDRAAPRFGRTTNPTEPSPLPFAAVEKEIHEALLLAVHAQPDGAVMVIVPNPPRAAIDALVGLIA